MMSIIVQQTKQLQTLTQEVKHLNEQVELVQNTMKTQQEKQRQQNQQRVDVDNEFRQLFQNLHDHICYSMETLRKEFDDRLGKPLDIPTFDLITNSHSSGKSYIVKEQSILQDSASTNNYIYNNGVQVHDFQTQEQDSATYKHINTNNATEIQYCEERVDFVDQKGKSIEQNKQADTGTTPAANSKELCSEATGIYADAISFLKSQDSNIQEPRYEPRGRSRDVRRRNREIISTNPSITYIPDVGAEFFIPNTKMFQASKQDFFTQYLYTRPKACKVRHRLWFNKHGRLGVHLLVSEGELDKLHRWPKIFEGHGYIYNQSSQTYTRLWSIESQECHMPTKKKEEILGASVCLFTSRDPCEDVTYDLLTKKHYVADGDRLLFRWNLRITEVKD